MLTYLLKYPLSPTNISTSLLTKILSRFIKYLRFDCSDYFLRYDTEQIIGRKEETRVHSIFVKIQDKHRAHKPLQLQSFRIIQIRTIFAIFLSRLTSAKARSHAYLYVCIFTHLAMSRLTRCVLYRANARTRVVSLDYTSLRMELQRDLIRDTNGVSTFLRHRRSWDFSFISLELRAVARSSWNRSMIDCCPLIVRPKVCIAHSFRYDLIAARYMPLAFEQFVDIAIAISRLVGIFEINSSRQKYK